MSQARFQASEIESIKVNLNGLPELSYPWANEKKFKISVLYNKLIGRYKHTCNHVYLEVGKPID